MKYLNKYKNIIFGTIVFLFLFSFISVLQIRYDKIVHPVIKFNYKVTKNVMDANFVKLFSFGFRNVLADYYWINIIQDLAGWDRSDDFYVQEFRNLVTLDPKFAYPYLFGVLTISVKTDPNSVYKAEEIAKIGIENLPYNWEIPFYLGTTFNLVKNYEKALEYVEIAVTRPIIPESVSHAYKSFSKKVITGDNATRAFVQTIYDTTESDTTKKIIREGMIVSDLTVTLKKVVDDYKIIYKKYPKSIDDIVDKKMIEIAPALKTEFDVIIDGNTGDVEIKPKNSY